MQSHSFCSNNDNEKSEGYFPLQSSCSMQRLDRVFVLQVRISFEPWLLRPMSSPKSGSTSPKARQANTVSSFKYLL